MGTAVIPHGDASPVLDSSKHPFHHVAVPVKLFVYLYGYLASLARRDARLYAPLTQAFPEPVRIVAAIGKE